MHENTTRTEVNHQAHVARLAKELAEQPRVFVQNGDGWVLGRLQTLDLRQAEAAGVLVDQAPGIDGPGFVAYAPEQVHLFSSLKEQLMNFIEAGVVGDGYLISKADRTTLCQLGLAERVPNGWNIVTAAGVAAAENAGWLTHS